MSLFSAKQKHLSFWLRPIILIALFAALLTGCKKDHNDAPVDNQIYTGVEQDADFPGGIDAFYSFLTSNIHYPAQARKDNIQGEVFAQFVIEKDGSLDEIKILQGIGDGCDEEVVRVLKLSPKWNPGMQDGRAVRQQFTIPINFVLSTSQTASISVEGIKTGSFTSETLQRH